MRVRLDPAAAVADDGLVIPGFASAADSRQALRRTPPALALLALLGQTNECEFLCIGRDHDGLPTAIVVPADEFRVWLQAMDAAAPQRGPLC